MVAKDARTSINAFDRTAVLAKQFNQIQLPSVSHSSEQPRLNDDHLIFDRSLKQSPLFSAPSRRCWSFIVLGIAILLFVVVFIIMTRLSPAD
jgi:hypothetical protein